MPRGVVVNESPPTSSRRRPPVAADLLHASRGSGGHGRLHARVACPDHRHDLEITYRHGRRRHRGPDDLRRGDGDLEHRRSRRGQQDRHLHQVVVPSPTSGSASRRWRAMASPRSQRHLPSATFSTPGPRRTTDRTPPLRSRSPTRFPAGMTLAATTLRPAGHRFLSVRHVHAGDGPGRGDGSDRTPTVRVGVAASKNAPNEHCDGIQHDGGSRSDGQAPARLSASGRSPTRSP